MKKDKIIVNAEGVEVLVAVDLIDPAPWNEDREVDEQLTASMSDPRIGQLQPVILRPKGERFEMVSGHRRMASAKIIGWPNLRAVVRDLSDAEAMDVTLIENNHRAANTPMQQARILLKRAALPGFDASALAVRLGWTPGTLRRRMNLLELAPELKRELENPASAFACWSLAQWEFLAALPAAMQEALVNQGTMYSGPEQLTLDRMRRFASDHSMMLKTAPWDLADETLCPERGSCAACPNRSGARLDLLEGAIPTKAKADLCLVQTCWGEKAQAHKARVLEQMREQHDNVVVIHDSYSVPAGELAREEFKPAKKGERGAVPAVWGSGSKEGEVTWVVPKAEGARKAAKASGEPVPPKLTMKQKRAALDARRWVSVAQEIEGGIDGKKVRRPKSATLARIAALAATFGVDGMRPDYAAAAKLGKDQGKAADSLWEAVLRRLARNLRQAVMNKNAEADARAVAAILEQDADELFEAAVEKIPTPKSWGEDA